MKKFRVLGCENASQAILPLQLIIACRGKIACLAFLYVYEYPEIFHHTALRAALIERLSEISFLCIRAIIILIMCM